MNWLMTRVFLEKKIVFPTTKAIGIFCLLGFYLILSEHKASAGGTAPLVAIFDGQGQGALSSPTGFGLDGPAVHGKRGGARGIGT
jgi:hypothetical protein